ncbi:MAG: hypothetical protein PHE17_20005 [Thiothrix sp.]|uniref:hypothetical protein n=1 Tax=Thiothrix sp. TaxID=1032 RepID=UPI00263039D1|nr:hypothetical protein [Thiothrix sp.]MDD5395314.1 hypothetical protein [Thiothrix sp.]
MKSTFAKIAVACLMLAAVSPLLMPIVTSCRSTQWFGCFFADAVSIVGFSLAAGIASTISRVRHEEMRVFNWLAESVVSLLILLLCVSLIA